MKTADSILSKGGVLNKLRMHLSDENQTDEGVFHPPVYNGDFIWLKIGVRRLRDIIFEMRKRSKHFNFALLTFGGKFK